MASIVGNAVDALIGVEVVHGVVHADGALVVAVPPMRSLTWSATQPCKRLCPQSAPWSATPSCALSVSFRRCRWPRGRSRSCTVSALWLWRHGRARSWRRRCRARGWRLVWRRRPRLRPVPRLMTLSVCAVGALEKRVERSEGRSGVSETVRWCFGVCFRMNQSWRRGEEVSRARSWLLTQRTCLRESSSSRE